MPTKIELEEENTQLKLQVANLLSKMSSSSSGVEEDIVELHDDHQSSEVQRKPTLREILLWNLEWTMLLQLAESNGLQVDATRDRTEYRSKLIARLLK